MNYADAALLENRGDRFGLIRAKQSEDQCCLLELAWINHYRGCFVASVSSIAEGRKMARKRLRQIDDLSTNNDHAYVGIDTRQPKTVEAH